MKNHPEIGARIAEVRKSVRFEKRFYCPHDGRMVAAVVPFEGERYLWIVGGRDEHAQALLGELFQALAEHRENEDLNRKYGSTPDEHEKIHQRLLDAYRSVSQDGHTVTSPTAYRLADEFYKGEAALREAGYDMGPLPHPAPCPRCHRSVILRVTPDGVTQDAP